MSRELVKDKKTQRDKPKDKWVVIMYNDESTTMDFVVYVLMNVFNKPFNDACTLMLQIHCSDKQVVGIYPEKLANAKRNHALDLAKQYNQKEFRVEVEQI